ncbi:hypothetical protein GRX66_15255, partial [Halobacterium sp. PCN9]
MYDSRDDVPETHRFDLTRIFESRADWRAACDELESDIADFDTDRPLGEVLTEFESLSARDHRLRTYADLRANVQRGDDQRASDRTRAESLHGGLLALRDDVERRIRGADPDAHVPGRFERYVDDVHRRADHALHPDASDLLGALDDVLAAPTRVHSALVDGDFDSPTVDVAGESVTLTRSERSRIQQQGDRAVRE